MKRTTIQAFLLTSLLSLSLAACKKKEETAAAPSPTEPAAGTAAAPTPPPAEPPAPTPPATPPAPPPPAAPTIASADDYKAKGVELMGKMIELFKTGGSDCDKLATDLDAYITSNGPLIKALQDFEKANPAAKKDFDKASKAQRKEFETAAGPALKACSKHEGLKKAFEKLAGE